MLLFYFFYLYVTFYISNGEFFPLCILWKKTVPYIGKIKRNI